MDTFRECYPLSHAYTWTNGTTSTRINYIWLSASWSQMLLDASILDSQLITDSDHWIVKCVVNTSEIISGMTKQQEGKMFERLVFEYDKAEPKHWDRFTKLTEDLFLESDLWKIWDNDLIDAQTKSDML